MLLKVVFIGIDTGDMNGWVARAKEVRTTVSLLDPACRPNISSFRSVQAGMAHLNTTKEPVDLVVVENQIGMGRAELEKAGAALAENMRHLAGKSRVKIDDYLGCLRRAFEAQNVGVMVVSGEMRHVLCALMQSRQTDPSE